jgi:hypothetical protein
MCEGIIYYKIKYMLTTRHYLAIIYKIMDNEIK